MQHSLGIADQFGHFPSIDVQLQAGLGVGKWFRLFATPSQNSSQRLICLMQDIDEQKQIELAKENFTAMVSHELRTPLTALVGALGLLQGLHAQNMGKDAQNLLDLAMRGGERLSGLVNDILEFFKLQSGGLPVSNAVQPLKPVVEQALDSVQALLQARQLTVQVVGLEADTHALLDSSRAQQVLINLLANAIRFSPSGSTLWLEGLQTENFVRLDVRDAGPGIEPSFQGQIFKPFAQANAGNTRDNNSSGLGLSISRGLMRQMGGELSFSSPLGQGATFHVDFLRQAIDTRSE
jgi:signal transduction histidine kinase